MGWKAGHVYLLQCWKKLSCGVLHRLAWGTGRPLSFVSYEPGLSLVLLVKIPVDCWEGAKDVALRSPKKPLSRSLSDFLLPFIGITSRALGGSNRCYRNSSDGEEVENAILHDSCRVAILVRQRFSSGVEAECCVWLAWPPIASRIAVAAQ